MSTFKRVAKTTLFLYPNTYTYITNYIIYERYLQTKG